MPRIYSWTLARDSQVIRFIVVPFPFLNKQGPRRAWHPRCDEATIQFFHNAKAQQFTVLMILGDILRKAKPAHHQLIHRLAQPHSTKNLSETPIFSGLVSPSSSHPQRSKLEMSHEPLRWVQRYGDQRGEWNYMACRLVGFTWFLAPKVPPCQNRDVWVCTCPCMIWHLMSVTVWYVVVTEMT